MMPPHVAEMQPDRYRWLAEEHLEEWPDDTHGAAMAVRRAFAEERRTWLREHGVRRWVDGRDTLTTALPPYAWVMSEFGTPDARWPE